MYFSFAPKLTECVISKIFSYFCFLSSNISLRVNELYFRTTNKFKVNISSVGVKYNVQAFNFETRY